jgi:hypothetical protein
MRTTRLVCLLAAIWFSQLQAAESKPKSQPTIQTKKEQAKVMTNKEAWVIYEKYVQAWNPISDEQRIALATAIIAEDAQYSSPILQAGGRNSMIERMSAFQKQFPGGHFDIGDVSAHHDVALLTWILVQADGTIVAKGHDQIRVSAEGKIVSLITFAPSVPEP